jgi:hypothetical protein
MTKTRFTLISICLTFSHGYSHAQKVADSNTTWHWGLNLGGQTYQENIMQLEGLEWGVVGKWDATDLLKVESQWSSSKLNYSSTKSGTMSNIRQTEGALHLIGASWRTAHASKFEPTLQWAFTHNDLRGLTSTGAAGYERHQDKLWAGARWTQTLDPKEWSMDAISIEVQGLLHARQRSDLSQADPQRRDVLTRAHPGWALEVRGHTTAWQNALTPYLRWEDIAVSNTVFDGVGQVKEPANQKLSIGLSWWIH